MATYSELFDLKTDTSFRNKVSVAATIKSQSLIDGVTPTSAEITWANNTLIAPLSRANTLVNYVIAANDGLSVAAIQGATDADIQSNVDAAADALIAGGTT